MLVYANWLRVQGADAESAVFKAVGGWLKEQMGFGLPPDQLRREGEYKGHRGEHPSRLRIYSCYENDPALCAWVLKHAAEDVHGRQWIVEVGVKKSAGTLEVSCVVKTDEQSTLVTDTVSASQPRVVRYIVKNVRSATNADFADAVPGEIVRTIGEDRDSYLAFAAEIGRADRDGAIVLVSSTREGEYIVNPTQLQTALVGLANVVKVLPGSNTYDMTDVLGSSRSAWDGSVNVLSMPSMRGVVRYRYFLPDEIRAWGEEPQRISRLLAWVTASTNMARLRRHVRPEGVALLAMRRRMEQLRATSAQMNERELRQALEEASEREAEQDRYFDKIAEENANLEDELSNYKQDLEEAKSELGARLFELKSLKDGLFLAGGGSTSPVNPDELLEFAARKEEPSPLACIEIIEKCYGDRCIVLDSARNSARKMTRFIHGRDLLDLLRRLVTKYRDRLLEGGDSKARCVFGQSEYAAKESKSVMANKDMRRQRTFDYNGQQVPMFQHLKIGVAADQGRTIRVHFHWDADRQRIVIGYCGEHLSVSSH